MKIGIITRRSGFNMGTSLQAFAMSKFIEDAGYPNQIIDYDEYSGHRIWKIKPLVNHTLLFLMNICPSLSRKLFGSKYKCLLLAQKQMNSFIDFERNFLPLTDKRYSLEKDLERDFKNYDACICGSDQIWSPYFFDSVFFLSFLKKNYICKKIAYAPSMGITDRKMVKKEQIELLNDLDFISCREVEASQIVSEITTKEIPTVLDPTLMVNFKVWEDMANEVTIDKKEKYILTYFLHTDYYQDSIPYQYIQKLKEETKLPIYNISLFNLVNNINADKEFETVGPLEFLALIKNATWVCTNSFHCCIFSYVFKRKFFVFKRYMRNGGDGANQNSRIINLMKLFSMEQCVVNTDDTPCTGLKYDFEKGMSLLGQRQLESLIFLKKALA